MATNPPTIELYTSMEPVMATHIEYKGMLMCSKVKSRNMFSDIGSGENQIESTNPYILNFVKGLKSLVGGEIKGLSKLTSDVREELLTELKEKAEAVGANAVIGLR